MSFRFARPSRRAAYAITLATLLTASLFAQQPKVLAPHRPIALGCRIIRPSRDHCARWSAVCG
jgi:hypothetical protein